MIRGFQGEYRFLSNFWPAPVGLDGVTYRSVEYAYQAAKTLDPLVRASVVLCRTPGDVKRLGRVISPIRPDWSEVKLGIMGELVWQKFKLPDLRQKLLNTGSQTIEETNTWGDTYWGVCNGKGANHLGLILMDVRSRIIASPL